MHIKTETEYQNNPVIIKTIEVLTGGGTIAAADFNTALITELAAGALVGNDSNGLTHLIKTAEVHENAIASATAIKVKKNHAFIVGDLIVDAKLALKAYAITAITTTETDYDTITIGTAIGALTAGDVIVKATAEATTAGDGAYAYTPIGITVNPADLTLDNQPVGILVRGSVNQANMEYPIDATLIATLPLIRFENPS